MVISKKHISNTNNVVDDADCYRCPHCDHELNNKWLYENTHKEPDCPYCNERRLLYEDKIISNYRI